MKEEWRQIDGYEEWYDVSNFGQVRRMKEARNTFVGRVLNPSTTGQGYKLVTLSRDGNKHQFTVHRLVAGAFIGMCPNNLEVNHKDGDKTNNRLDNLEYVTQSENSFHAYRTGLNKGPRGEKACGSKLTEKGVREIKELLGKETQRSIAVRFNVHFATINAIATGQNWSWVK